MAKIEDRIVSMKFDNKQFMSAASDTMGALEKLKQALNPANLGRGMKSAFGKDTFSGVSAGAKEAAESVKMVSEAANSTDLSQMSSAASNVGGGFTAMQGVALGALASIGAKAVEIGGQVVKAFTLDPVMDGFAEYETKINAIQRIQANTASKGTTMDDITKSLDELNEYSDQTIYNFGQMADNIGRFTAGGVDLETSVQAIKGVSNVAALAGASSAESARVGTQLAQAIGGGEIRLQDWMSVEHAGMDNEIFKTALYEAGKRMGTLTDVPVGKTFQEWTEEGNLFRNTLQDGWLNVDVMNEALGVMAGDMDEAQLMAMGYSEEQAKLLALNAEMAVSSASDIKTFTQLMDTLKESAGSAWVGVFESVFGGLDEAKALFTGINDFLEPIVTRFPNMISSAFMEWSALGGRTDFFEGVKNILEQIGKLLGPIGEAFGAVFKPLSGEAMANASKSFREFSENIKVSDQAATAIRVTFQAIFTVMKAGLTVVGNVAKVLGTAFLGVLWVIERLLTAVGSVFEFFGKLGEAFTQLKQIFTTGDFVEGPFKEFDWAVSKVFELRAAMLQLSNIILRGDFIAGPFEESDWIIDKVFTLREALMQIKEIFTTGDFIGGPFEEDSGFIDRLMTIAEKIANVRQAMSLLFEGDYRGDIGSTFEEDDAIVVKLLRIREVMQNTFDYWKNLSWEDVQFSAETIFGHLGDVDFGSIESIKSGIANIVNDLTVFGYEDTLNVLNNFQQGVEDFISYMANLGGNLATAVSAFGTVDWSSPEQAALYIGTLADVFTGISMEDAGRFVLRIYELGEDLANAWDLLSVSFGSADNLSFAIAASINDIFNLDLDLTDFESLMSELHGYLDPIYDFGNQVRTAFQFISQIDFSEAIGSAGNRANIAALVAQLTPIQYLDARDAVDKIDGFVYAVSTYLRQIDFSKPLMDAASGNRANVAALIATLSPLNYLDAKKMLAQVEEGMSVVKNYDYVGLFDGLRERVVKMGSDLGNWISDAVASVDWNAVGAGLAKGLVALGGIILGAIGVVATLITDFLKSLFSNLDLSPLLGIFEGAAPILKEAFGRIGELLVAMGPSFSKGVQIIANIFGGLLRIIGEVINAIADVFANFDLSAWFGRIVDQIANMDISAIITSIGIALAGGAAFEFVKVFKQIFSGFGDITEGAGDLIGQVTDNLKVMEQEVRAENIASIATSMLKMAAAVAILSVSLLVFASIPFEDMKVGLMGLAGVVLILVAAMTILSKIEMPSGSPLDPKGDFKTNLLTTLKDISKAAFQAPMIAALGVALVGFGISVALLTASLYALGKMSIEEITRGLIALVGILAAMVIAVNLLPEKKVLQSALAIFALATAVKSIQKGLEKMGQLSWEEIARGLIALSVSMAVLVGATMLLDEMDVDKVSGSFFKLAISMMVFAAALQILNKVSWQAMLKGFLTLVTVLGGIILVGKTVPESSLAKIGTQLILVASSLFIFAAAMKMFSNMKWETIGKGLLSVLGVMVVLGLGFKTFPTAKVGASAVTILAVSASLLVLAYAVQQLTQIDLLGAAVAVGVLAGAMVALSFAMDALSKKQAGVEKKAKKPAKGFNPGPILQLGAAMLTAAVGIGAMAIALTLLLPAVAGFAALGLKNVAIGMGGIAIALGVLALGGYLLQPVIWVFIGLAGAMMGIALASALFSAGLMGAAAAVALLAVAGAGAIALLPQLAIAIAQAFVNIIATLAAAAPDMANGLVQIFYNLMVAIRDVIIQGGPVLLEAFVGLLAILSQAIVQGTPLIADAIITLLEEILRLVIEVAPDLADAILVLLDAVLTVIAEGIPMVVDHFLFMLSEVMRVIGERAPEVAESFVTMIENILAAIGEQAPRIIAAMTQLMNDVANAIRTEGPAFREAAKNLFSAIKDELVAAGKEWLGALGGALGDMLSEIGSWIGEFFNAAVRLGNSIKDGIVSALRNARATISRTMATLTGGIIGDAEAGLEINSPSRVFMRIGGHVVDGLTNGIDDNAGKSARASGKMATGVIDEAQNTLGIRSPSTVFKEIGGNVTEGLAIGIEDGADAPVRATENMFDRMLRIANDSSMAIGDKVIGVFSATPITQNLERLTRKARRDREEAFDTRAEAVEARELELAEEIESQHDSIASAKDSAQKAREDADAIKADAEKSQNEKDRAERKAEQAHKKIAKEELKLQESLEEESIFQAEKAGYLAGGAWADGVIDGVTDSEGRILSEAELISNRLYEEYDKFSEETDDFVGVLESIGTVSDSFTSIGDSVENFRRAFRRLNSATTDRSLKRNLGMMFDEVMNIVGALTDLMGVLEVFEPYLPGLLSQFDSALPGIIALVQPFAPQLAATLGGGLAAALPAIAGPALGIIAALAGIFIFLDDMAGDQIILDVFGNIVKGIASFLRNLPRMILQFVRTMIRGFIIFVRMLPTLIPQIIEGLADLIVEIILQLPDLIVGLVEALIDLFLFFMTSPGLIVDLAVGIIKALLGALPRIVAALGEAFFDLGKGLVKAIVDGFLSVVQIMIDTILEPFRWLFDLIEEFTGFDMPDLDFRIAPKLDFSDYDRDLDQIETSGPRDVPGWYNPNTTMTHLDAISAGERESLDNSMAGAGSGNTYIEYNQYNTSPRPLSSIEIYRNTQKQLEGVR